ncbi:MAG: hypothetical protein WBE37_28305 [Bryobacteraceae bacterium]
MQRPGSPASSNRAGRLRDPAPRFESGKSFVGSSNGLVTTIDADSGSMRWRHRSATPMLAAIRATASGPVFTVT